MTQYPKFYKYEKWTAKDRVKKYRSRVLSDTQVREICATYTELSSPEWFGEKYHVRASTILYIIQQFNEGRI
jgi:hypothetical protein